MNGVQTRKPLPQRPSEDMTTGGYGPYPTRSQEMVKGTAQLESRTQLPQPNGRVILEGYRKDIINNFEGEKPRFNPVSCTKLHMYKAKGLTSMVDECDKTTKLHASKCQ